MVFIHFDLVVINEHSLVSTTFCRPNKRSAVLAILENDTTMIVSQIVLIGIYPSRLKNPAPVIALVASALWESTLP